MITNLATGESFDTAAPGVEPLEVVGRLVQEDICILAAGEGGHQRLLGGVVCFPAHWSVLEKLGKILPDIHDPVPRWRSDAAGPARAFLSALRPEQPFIRWNWTLMPTAELHLSNFYEPPPAPHAAAPEDVSGIERLHLRLERQYFHRLPRSGCLVFTIRTYQRPIREAVEGRPTMAAALAGALRDLPYAHLEYKVGLQHRLPALLELLDAAAQGEGGREGEGGQEGSAGGVVAATATSM
ncbi:hypothetical protein HYH03_016160 [Edaphochlamys debaryana]|uniref:DUF3445 domain-containing protein n=1 Tax=Edaphochlamys debaryana TaxID=47281 RepID=A0A835XLM1_9CHLO|nr:hypothetical protein HYH03_016160 [Edaphochlamys debaryana]|eukprot:KAG2485063.1 hypothetical protein HYH03_016160 [Edaphochlamys debaryana]